MRTFYYRPWTRYQLTMFKFKLVETYVKSFFHICRLVPVVGPTRLSPPVGLPWHGDITHSFVVTKS